MTFTLWCLTADPASLCTLLLPPPLLHFTPLHMLCYSSLQLCSRPVTLSSLCLETAAASEPLGIQTNTLTTVTAPGVHSLQHLPERIKWRLLV